MELGTVSGLGHELMTYTLGVHRIDADPVPCGFIREPDSETVVDLGFPVGSGLCQQAAHVSQRPYGSHQFGFANLAVSFGHAV
jgi:hypothetical protein